MFQAATRRRAGTWALMAALTLSAAVGAEDVVERSTPLSELFEQATFAEESLGDLDRAIVLYQEILERSDADRAYAAQAQFRLALCYLRRGDEVDAVTALRTLVADFPRQRELVEKSRDRLRDLGYALPESGLRLRQVWDNGGGMSGSLTSDGRYLSFTDWTTGDLAVHDFDTGRDRRLTGKGSWDTPSYAESSVISPDGRLVAYAWFANTEVLYDLRVVGTDGSAPKVVFARKEIQWVQPIDWSPDGRRIFTFLSGESTAGQLAWVSLEDGAVEAVGPSRDYPAGKVDLSPDGKLAVYDMPIAGSPKRDIFVLEVETGVERALVEHPADDRVLGWSPTGKRLVFASDRTGDWSAWSVSVAGGKPVGAPELAMASLAQVFPNGQLWPIGFTRGGAFLYGVGRNFNDVYLVDIAPSATDRKPVPVTQRFEGTNVAPVFSPDGRRLAWLSRREEGYFLVTGDLARGEEREVKVSEQMTRIMAGFGGLRWSPDGASVLVAGKAKEQESWQGLFTIDVETGEAEQVVAAPSDGAVRSHVLSPDGRSLYFVSLDAIVCLDLKTGERRQLFDGHVGNIALSPDGSRLAFTSDFYAGDRVHSLKVLPVSGTNAREIFRATGSEIFEPQTALTWSADGRHVIFGTVKATASRGESPGTELWRVPADGGERERLGITMPYLRNVRVHPGEERLAFQAGTREPQIWMLENFLPDDL